MNTSNKSRLTKVLRWEENDIEQRFGVKGGKYTDVNLVLTFICGLMLTIIFYALQFVFSDCQFAALFLKRGITPYFIVFFTSWALSILIIKWLKLKLQRRALNVMVVPQTAGYEITTETAKDILIRISKVSDDPKHFVLLNRIERALANLKNIGLISDVSEILAVQSQNDEDHLESSYSIIRGLIWAIPILGFIGTVLGLSKAIGNFGSVLVNSEGLETLKASLQDVTSGLSVAFDTTLIALIAALCIQLIMTAIKKKEESFLDDCKDYCHAYIISRLRLSQSQENRFGNYPGNRHA
jgi:biopolymer transport protein ExbB/TolQ